MTADAIVFPPRTLDEAGRCCGRKPHPYKTREGMGRAKDPHLCCFRCSAEYTPDGRQRANWAWLSVPGGFTPKYPSGAAASYVEFARRALGREESHPEMGAREEGGWS